MIDDFSMFWVLGVPGFRALANMPADFIGKISYPLYLLHMPIVAQINQFDLFIGLKLLLSFILSVLVAYVSYRFFEKPVARLLRSIASNKSSQEER